MTCFFQQVIVAKEDIPLEVKENSYHFKVFKQFTKSPFGLEQRFFRLFMLGYIPDNSLIT